MKVYVIKKIDHLRDGQTHFHVEVFDSHLAAKEALNSLGQEYQDERGCKRRWKREDELHLIDEDWNFYEFRIEVKELQA